MRIKAEMRDELLEATDNLIISISFISDDINKCTQDTNSISYIVTL